MAETSLERTPFARAGCARIHSAAGRAALHRASLLIGTGLFLHSAPAWAVNECGPPPPGGGTLICPAGEYPNGIDYPFATNLELILEPGVVTRDGSLFQVDGLRILGPVNTSLNNKTPGGFNNKALFVVSNGPVFAHLDDVTSTAATGGVEIVGYPSATLIVDTVVSTVGTAIQLAERRLGFGPVIQPAPGASLQVNSVISASRGIVISSENGDVRADVGSVSTSGISLAPGIESFQYAVGRSTFIESATIETRGADSRGIEAGGGSMFIDSGSVITHGDRSAGLLITGRQHVEIASASISTAGNSSRGISATSNLSDVEIESGSISTIGSQSAGMFVTALANITLLSDSITTAGPQSPAISATSAAGEIAVDSRFIRTQASESQGIVVRSTDGAIRIDSDSIETLGSSSPAIEARSQTGTVVIDSGTVSTLGAASPGILADSGGAVAVSVNNVSVTGANSDAITVKGSTSTVTIRGLVQSGQGLAVRAQDAPPFIQGPGGPTTVNIIAGGTLRGRVSLTPGSDRIANSGTFDAIGTSQLGTGADVFNNNAGGTVRSVNGAATFAGLETFDNRALIDLRDGATNDSLTLSGAYSGAAGARLDIDVDFGTGTADRLITGAATGSTLIDVQGSGGGFTSGILVVDAGAGTSPTAFTLAGGSDSAYLHRNLQFDAANNDFLLVNLPGAAVFETARFGAMAGQLWYESADAVAAQLDTVRDGRRGRGVALWLQVWTGERERSGTQTLAGAGTFDVSFEQDFQGLQGGLDFQSGSAVFGITGGAGRSDAIFAATGSPVDMEVKNVGLYAQGRAGPLFFNALAKRDWAELEIAPGAGLGAEFDADLFGIQANAGLRFDLGAIFVEPSVGLSWVQANLDSFESGPATVEPGGVDSLRARAGLRAGARLPLGGGALLPFAAVDVYEELGDGNETDFTLGETLRLFDEPAGTRGEAAAGVSFVAGSFEAFVRGEMDFSGSVDAKAARAGARLRF